MMLEPNYTQGWPRGGQEIESLGNHTLGEKAQRRWTIHPGALLTHTFQEARRESHSLSGGWCVHPMRGSCSPEDTGMRKGSLAGESAAGMDYSTWLYMLTAVFPPFFFFCSVSLAGHYRLWEWRALPTHQGGTYLCLTTCSQNLKSKLILPSRKGEPVFMIAKYGSSGF